LNNLIFKLLRITLKFHQNPNLKNYNINAGMGGKNYMLVYMLNKHEKPLMPGNLPERHEYKL
jgi:hypothetical protein